MKLAHFIMWIQTVLYLVAGVSYLSGKDYRLGFTSLLYGVAIYTLYLL
jgi:hypothetical protein